MALVALPGCAGFGWAIFTRPKAAQPCDDADCWFLGSRPFDIAMNVDRSWEVDGFQPTSFSTLNPYRPQDFNYYNSWCQEWNPRQLVSHSQTYMLKQEPHNRASKDNRSRSRSRSKIMFQTAANHLVVCFCTYTRNKNLELTLSSHPHWRYIQNKKAANMSRKPVPNDPQHHVQPKLCK